MYIIHILFILNIKIIIVSINNFNRRCAAAPQFGSDLYNVVFLSMENMRYAEELLREFLVFRGFTTTLQLFESELSTEIGRNFDVDKILHLIFSVYIPQFQLISCSLY
jgi:hypothetical protein